MSMPCIVTDQWDKEPDKRPLCLIERDFLADLKARRSNKAVDEFEEFMKAWIVDYPHMVFEMMDRSLGNQAMAGQMAWSQTRVQAKAFVAQESDALMEIYG